MIERTVECMAVSRFSAITGSRLGVLMDDRECDGIDGFRCNYLLVKHQNLILEIRYARLILYSPAGVGTEIYSLPQSAGGHPTEISFRHPEADGTCTCQRWSILALHMRTYQRRLPLTQRRPKPPPVDISISYHVLVDCLLRNIFLGLHWFLCTASRS